ncbi:MAG: 23S rRNA (guanosine(2251)-2'-O)-methyltransferase RlmB [Prevotellaceae bacterium]|jgi:23S rRNA (guanosine2251-2'-O)-methyltransferase|nr:23S rRNA (guanosine(2251)-2'-O)-methyltransferase RlmB [Prevotellaceae bacterium]
MEGNKIFGLRPVLEALNANRNFEKILIRESADGDLLRRILSIAKEKNITTVRAPLERINRLTKNGNHQGIVAFLSSAEYSDLEQILENINASGKKALLLLLDKITDVRNFGAIVRTAECAGVDAVIVPAKNAAPMNVDAMKTSSGALNYVPVCKVSNLKSAIYLIRSYNIKIFAATEKADKNYFDADLSGSVAIIMGSEESGISKGNLEVSDELVKIPLQGNIDSLNVSAAAAVVAFECVRQRKGSVKSMLL